MIAKKIADGRQARGGWRGFANRLRYVCGKAVSVEVRNLAGSWTDAAAQMERTAGMNPRLAAPCLHIVLSWSALENPDPAEMIAAARQVLAEMGAGEHQCVIALHQDRPSPHAHLVVNRVHPVTGRSLNLSHDHARLEAACRRVERRFGWPQDRGRFLPVTDGERLLLAPQPRAHWEARIAQRQAGQRPQTPAVRAAEVRTGLPPLRDILTDEATRSLRQTLGQADGWAVVHGRLAAVGLAFCKVPGGARIALADLSTFMPASHLGEAFALRRMVRRLGLFQPAAAGVAKAALANLPAAKPLLLRPMTGAFTGALRNAPGHLPPARPSLGAARSALAGRQAEERRALDRETKGWPLPLSALFRQIQWQDHRAERRQLRHDILDARRKETAGAGPRDLAQPDPFLARTFRQLATAQERATAADHTLLRQGWMADALEQAMAGGPPPVDPRADDIRALAQDLVALARRNSAGGIVGFRLVDTARNSTVARSPLGEGEGLVLLGPRNAASCCLVLDPALALILSQGAAKGKLVICLDRVPTPREVDQLKRLTEGRKTRLIRRPAERDLAVLHYAMAALPHAILMELPDHPVHGPREPDKSWGPYKDPGGSAPDHRRTETAERSQESLTPPVRPVPLPSPKRHFRAGSAEEASQDQVAEIEEDNGRPGFE